MKIQHTRVTTTLAQRKCSTNLRWPNVGPMEVWYKPTLAQRWRNENTTYTCNNHIGPTLAQRKCSTNLRWPNVGPMEVWYKPTLAQRHANQLGQRRADEQNDVGPTWVANAKYPRWPNMCLLSGSPLDSLRIIKYTIQTGTL